MRFRFLVLLLLLLPVHTARSQSQPKARVILDVGSVPVWLGMSRAEAVRGFSDAGDEVRDVGPECPACKFDTVFILTGPRREEHTLRFQNGQLVFAESNTYIRKTDDMDATVTALAALADKNVGQPCSLSHGLPRHAQLSRSDVLIETATIDCGDRSVLVATFNYPEAPPMVEVSERIGKTPPLASPKHEF